MAAASRASAATTLRSAEVEEATDAPRAFENELPDYVDGAPVELDVAFLEQALADTMEQVSRARHGNSDPTVYVGTCGIAYSLFHVYSAGGSTTVNDAGHLIGSNGRVLATSLLQRGMRYTREAAALMQRYSKEQYGVSFMCGHAGVLATAAIMANEAASVLRARPGRTTEAAQLQKEAREHIRAFNALQGLAVSSFCREDEILYGRAGYMLAALQLNRLVGPETVPYTSIQFLAESILRSGRRQAAKAAQTVPVLSPLYYRWPTGRNARPYLGAAHGLMGIAYVLLHVRGMLQRSTRHELDAVLEAVLACECDAEGRAGPFGHYPTFMDELGSAPLVQWCHGATGAVFLFCKAYQQTRRQEYLEAALRAGDAVWSHGLLRKGPGLCHGVAGSAYALLSLHKATGAPKHLHRALQFARFMRSPRFLQEADEPDRPYSLYEGLAGAACLYADLLHPETATFPLFELRPLPGAHFPVEALSSVADAGEDGDGTGSAQRAAAAAPNGAPRP